MCNKCNLFVNEKKELEANLYSIKRQLPNKLGHMLL